MAVCRLFRSLDRVGAGLDDPSQTLRQPRPMIGCRKRIRSGNAIHSEGHQCAPSP